MFSAKFSFSAQLRRCNSVFHVREIRYKEHFLQEKMCFLSIISLRSRRDNMKMLSELFYFRPNKGDKAYAFITSSFQGTFLSLKMSSNKYFFRASFLTIDPYISERDTTKIFCRFQLSIRNIEHKLQFPIQEKLRKTSSKEKPDKCPTNLTIYPYRF